MALGVEVEGGAGVAVALSTGVVVGVDVPVGGEAAVAVAAAVGEDVGIGGGASVSSDGQNPGRSVYVASWAGRVTGCPAVALISTSPAAAGAPPPAMTERESSSEPAACARAGRPNNSPQVREILFMSASPRPQLVRFTPGRDKTDSGVARAAGPPYTEIVRLEAVAEGGSPMNVHADAEVGAPSAPAQSSRVYAEGIAAGVLGGAAIALWFLLIDVANGRPLFTPTVLGTALFRGGAGLESPGTLPISFEMVVVFTWVHFLVFAVIGGAVARLLAVVERAPSSGFGILLLFVVFECGFIAISMAVADAVLDAVGHLALFAGNLLAAAVMVVYFRLRHPALRILP